jgi:hypothetical protein
VLNEYRCVVVGVLNEYRCVVVGVLNEYRCVVVGVLIEYRCVVVGVLNEYFGQETQNKLCQNIPFAVSKYSVQSGLEVVGFDLLGSPF